MNEEIKNIVSKFVEKLSPKTVYLFGSYARGDYNNESDYDFYIIMPENYSVSNKTTSDAYVSLRGLKRRPVDIIVNNEKVFKERCSYTNALENTVKKEGKIVYEK